MSDATLRPATAADVPAIVALLEAAHLPAVELEEHLDNMVVVEQAGGGAACGGLEVYPGVDAGLVRSMAVEEGLQGSGVGTGVLEWVFARAREAGLSQLFLFTMHAAPFYERFGFRFVSLDEFPEGARHSAQYRAVRQFGKEWGVVAMGRSLGKWKAGTGN